MNNKIDYLINELIKENIKYKGKKFPKIMMIRLYCYAP